MLDGYKMKIGSILLAIFTFLTSVEPTTAIVTIGNFIVTVGTIEGIIGFFGAAFLGWGASVKGDKILGSMKK